MLLFKKHIRTIAVQLVFIPILYENAHKNTPYSLPGKQGVFKVGG